VDKLGLQRQRELIKHV